MSINVQNLEQIILDKMNNTSSELELLEYSKMLTELKTGIVQVVDTFNDLPDFSTSVGHLYYVKAEKAVYVGMSQTGWENLGAYPSSMLYSVGTGNFRGNLAVGDNFGRTTWTREITNSTNWRSVYGAYETLVAIKNDGTLWWAGSGDPTVGSNQCRSSPVQIGSDTDWCHVGIGYRFAGYIKTDNSLYMTGAQNCVGSLGDNTTVAKAFVQIPGSWTKVTAGYKQTTALKTDGTVWNWGCNPVGQLGDGTVICRSSPVQEASSSSNWIDISSGRCHSAAVKSDGTLWSWGLNNQRNLLDGTSTCRSSPVQEFLSASDWCRVEISDGGTYAMKTNGTIWEPKSSLVQEISSSTDWCLISGTGPSGTSITAIKTNGTLWAWGTNTSYQLGDGTNINRTSPVQELFSLSDWFDVTTSPGSTHAIRLANP